MNMVESETSSQPDLRAAPKPIALRCDVCGEETIILPGCVNTTWVCSHCGATVRQAEPVGPRQRLPVIVEKARPSISFEQLEDELARLTMEQGIHRRKDDPRLPRLFERSGVFNRVPGDPRVPKVVRVYGTAFTMLGTMAAIGSTYSFVGRSVGCMLGSPRALSPLSALATLGIAVVTILAGNALRRSRRVAVYAAALACVCALTYSAFLFPSHYTSLLAGLLTVPLFVSAARHWKRFR